jgi:class 3 adenylate cyclase
MWKMYNSLKIAVLILVIPIFLLFQSCISNDIQPETFSLPIGEKTFELSGKWKFKQGDSLHWALPDFDDSNWMTHPVPGVWERNGYEGQGIYWYRAWIDVHQELMNSKYLALSFKKIISAAEIYWDGKLLVRYGTVGKSKETEKPGQSDYLFLIPNHSRAPGLHLISIRVSNYHTYSGGIIRIPSFGPYKQLFGLQEKRIGWMHILIGLFLLSGIYHLVLYFFNRNRKEYILIALLSLAESYFVVLTEMGGLLEVDLENRFGLVQIFLIIISILLYLFLTKQFEFSNRKLKFIVLGISGILILTLVLPNDLSNSELLTEGRMRWAQIIELIGIIIIFWAVGKRKAGSLFVAIGVLPFAFGTINSIRTLDDMWLHGGFGVFTVMMTIGLALKMRSFELEIQQTKDVFRRFVPDPILDKIANKGLRSIKLGGAEENFATVLFADIRGFTTIAEDLTPNETLNYLNKFMTCMQPEIVKKGGFINQYVGDEIMAIFHNEGHAEAAIDTAIEMLNVLKEQNPEQIAKGNPEIKIGIGINTGKVIWGTIGSETRMESAVIGDTVNLASRMQNLSKVYKTQILISDSTYANFQKENKYNIRNVDTVKVKGKTEPTTVYEILAKN